MVLNELLNGMTVDERNCLVLLFENLCGVFDRRPRRNDRRLFKIMISASRLLGAHSLECLQTGALCGNSTAKHAHGIKIMFSSCCRHRRVERVVFIVLRVEQPLSRQGG